MNIIEAIQQAESGKFIHNNRLKEDAVFLKYKKNGVFCAYRIVGKSCVYKFEVIFFNLSEIVDTSWEIIDKKFDNLE